MRRADSKPWRVCHGGGLYPPGQRQESTVNHDVPLAPTSEVLRAQIRTTCAYQPGEKISENRNLHLHWTMSKWRNDDLTEDGLTVAGCNSKRTAITRRWRKRKSAVSRAMQLSVRCRRKLRLLAFQKLTTNQRPTVPSTATSRVRLGSLDALFGGQRQSCANLCCRMWDSSFSRF